MFERLEIKNWEEKDRTSLLTTAQKLIKDGNVDDGSLLHRDLVETLLNYIKCNDFYLAYSDGSTESENREKYTVYRVTKWWRETFHDMKLSQKKLAIVCAALTALKTHLGDAYAKEIFWHVRTALEAARTEVLDFGSYGKNDALMSSGTLESMLKKLNKNKKKRFFSGLTVHSRALSLYTNAFIPARVSHRPK
ncbi:MAG: hypothetical protein KKE46_02665 [Gammaproteobacteria bacterium]|nr:hypothetical protein [Gammaproteobacteria bacterium]